VRDIRVGPRTVPPEAALPNPALPPTVLETVAWAADRGTATDGLRFLDAREAVTWLPWAEVHERALRAGATLRAAGVLPGERVALILPTSPTFVDAFLGVLAAGAVPAPLHPPPRHKGRLAEYNAQTAAMIRACRASAVIADKGSRRLLGETVRRSRPRLGVLAAEDLLRAEPLPAVLSDMDDLALIQFTSGTTRLPKAVARTHRQLLANTDAILDFLPRDAHDPGGAPYTPVGVSWLPLFHDMGLIGCFFVALRRPGQLVQLSPEAFLQHPAQWLRAISRYQGTVSAAPGFGYALCVERIEDADLEGVDLSSWRFALDGAEPVNPVVLRRFQGRFARWGLRSTATTPVYGLSEAGLAVTFSDPWQPFKARRFSREALTRGQVEEVRQVQGLGAPQSAQDRHTIELCSVGRPLRGFGVEIRDADCGLLPPNRVGRLWVRGPSLMDGYFDQRPSPLQDDWLDTGDLGFLYEGDLYLHGRAEDLVPLDGAQHSPHEIESAVDAVEGVRPGCSAAVGLRKDETDKLVLFVEYRERRTELAEDCRQAVLAATGLDPDLVVLVPPGTLPRTSSGKIRRQELLSAWQQGSLKPPTQVNAWSMAGVLARSALGYLRARGSDPLDPTPPSERAPG